MFRILTSVKSNPITIIIIKINYAFKQYGHLHGIEQSQLQQSL